MRANRTTLKHRIAILASGAGSNAKRIIEYFQNAENISIILVASNKADAGVLDIAVAKHIDTYLLNTSNFKKSDEFLNELKKREITFVVLAGFLLQVPENLTRAYHNRMVNIHPALLPAYGGKGMYGHFVHEAVHAAGEKESGITIHFVNEHYDEGEIVFQAKAPIAPTDGPSEIESKVRALEIEHFAPTIERILNNL